MCKSLLPTFSVHHCRIFSPKILPNVIAGVSDIPPTKPCPDVLPNPKISPAAYKFLILFHVYLLH